MKKMEKTTELSDIANMKHSNLNMELKKPRKYKQTMIERIGSHRFYKDWVNKDKHAIIDNKGKILGKFRIKATAFHTMNDIQNYPGELEVVDLDFNGKVITQGKLQ